MSKSVTLTIKYILSQSEQYDQGTFVSFTIDAEYAFAHAIHNMQQDCAQKYLRSRLIS